MAKNKKPEPRESDESKLIVSVDMPNGFTYTGRPKGISYLGERITLTKYITVPTTEYIIDSKNRWDDHKHHIFPHSEENVELLLDTTGAAVHISSKD